MIKKTAKGGLFYKRKARPIRKYIIGGLVVVLAGFGLSILISDNTPTAIAGSSDNSTAMAGIYSPVVDTNSPEVERTLIKSTGGRGHIEPLIKTFSVNLIIDGNTKTYDFIGRPTVADLIKKAEVELTDQDELSKRPDTVISAGETVTIVRVTTETFEDRNEAAFETEYVDDPTIEKGQTLVVQNGVNKITKDVYTIVYNDGVEVSRNLEYSEVIQEGQNEIVAQGTKEKPVEQPQQPETPATGSTSPQVNTPAPPSGGASNDSSQSSENTSSSESSVTDSEDATLAADSEPQNSESNTIAGYTYSKSITCTAFAYTAPAGARGASGNPAVVGTCAVDPSVIPLGTRLYIEDYGYAIANDTGGAIIGNTVDVFFNTNSECINWGRRTVKVYILD